MTPRPRPPPGGCWGGAAVGCCGASASSRIRMKRIAPMNLLERRRLFFAPLVVAQAKRLDRIQVFSGADDVGAMIRRGLRNGQIHRVLAVVMRIAVRVTLFGHQYVRDVRRLAVARNRRLRS